MPPNDPWPLQVQDICERGLGSLDRLRHILLLHHYDGPEIEELNKLLSQEGMLHRLWSKMSSYAIPFGGRTLRREESSPKKEKKPSKPAAAKRSSAPKAQATKKKKGGKKK